MTSYERNADGDPSALQGLQAYADDSPRDHEALTASLTDDRWNDGGNDDQDDYAALPPRRRWVDAGILAGVVAVGAVAGVFLARVDGKPAVLATTSSMADDAGLSVQVASMAETLTIPPPVTGPKLEVLAPSTQAAAAVMARRAPRPLQIVPPRAVQPPRPLELVERQRESQVAPSGQDAAASASDTQPSFACSDAPTLARAMVCGDRRLAILDQRMKQAYAAALSAGAPGDVLREDQEDWLNVREDAAQKSRGTVAAVYRQRIAELRQLADPEL